MLKLYTYFRSSAAYRVRIALNLKGLDYTAVPVHLVRNGGEQHLAEYVERNPLHLVPLLQDGELNLPQSLAIIEYLDEAYPATPLLPKVASERARVRALALSVACEVHPLNNLRVLNYLKSELATTDAQRDAWYKHWVTLGFTAIEQMLNGDKHTGRFCHSDVPSLADCCLVPQVFNAQRFKCPLEAFPTITRIYDACMQHPAFQRAAPAAQADAE